MYLNIDTYASWDENYVFHLGHPSRVNSEWKVSYSGETSHLNEISHLIQTLSKNF